MSRTILALAIALFLGTAMLADAQERMRTTAEIQAEIAKLKGELLRAKIAEEERKIATLHVPAHEDIEAALRNVRTLMQKLPDVLVVGLVDSAAEPTSIAFAYREADQEGVELVIDVMLAGFRAHAACIEQRTAADNLRLAHERFNQFLHQIWIQELQAAGKPIPFMPPPAMPMHGVLCELRETSVLSVVNSTTKDTEIAQSTQREDKEQRLAAMFREYQRLNEDNRFEEALIVARRAMEFAPEEPAVQHMYRMTQLVHADWQSRSIRERENHAPIHVGMDWISPGGHRSFHSSGVQTEHRRFYQPTTEQRILQQLNTPITLNVNRPISLEQALKLICAEVGIVPFIDRAALREANVLTSTMVRIPVANGIRAKSVLNAVLGQLDLAYTVDSELLRITTQRRARGVLITRWYYVGDLVDSASASATQSPHHGAPGWGGMMRSVGIGGSYGVSDIIQQVIEPESWVGTRYASADAEGEMKFHPATKSLAIRQTECVHHQIEELIMQIRKMNDAWQMNNVRQTAQEPHVVR